MQIKFQKESSCMSRGTLIIIHFLNLIKILFGHLQPSLLTGKLWPISLSCSSNWNLGLNCCNIQYNVGLCIKNFLFSNNNKNGDNRDLKHRRRRAQRTTTGSKISPYRCTAHAWLVVHVKFRTSKRQVCRPERTWVCIYGVFEVGNLFQTIEMKVVYLFNL